MLIQKETCILIPTCHRPAGLIRVIESIQRTSPDCMVVVATDPSDQEGRNIAAYFNIQWVNTPADYCGCHVAWNVALGAASKNARAFVIGADDLEFKDNWFTYAVKALRTIDGSGLVGLNDNHPQKTYKGVRYPTHFLATRDFIIQHMGGVIAFECYYADCSDVEAAHRAVRAKKYVYAPLAHADHYWGGCKKGADYTYTKSDPYRDQSIAIFDRRMGEGFPNDFPPVLCD